jgi:undecaprenyl-diphosphatase
MHLTNSQGSFGKRLWARIRALIALVRERVEVRLLVGVLLLLCGLGLFWVLADAVTEGDTGRVDEAVLLALRNPADLGDPLGPPWFEEMMRDLTALGGTAVLTLLTVTALLYLGMARHWRLAWLLLIVAVGSFVLNMLLKAGFDRPRPDLVPQGMVVYHASFPSGHAMTAASIYLTLGALVARIQIRRSQAALVMVTAMIVTVLVGISRIYLAVHWPSDVLAGWIVGSVWAIACYLAAWRIQRRRWTTAKPSRHTATAHTLTRTPDHTAPP